MTERRVQVASGSLLGRSIAREVLAPFLAWTGLLCLVLFVMAFLRGTDFLLGSAVEPLDFLRFTVALFPQFLVQAVPIAFLLALQLGLGRLWEDGELAAMQALGVSPLLLLRTPLLAATGLSLLLGLLAFTAQPWGHRALRATAQDMIRRNLSQDIRAGVFHEELLGFTLYAGEVEPGNRWRQVLVHDGRDPARPLLALGETGRLEAAQADNAIAVRLSQGSLHGAGEPGSGDYGVVEFEEAAFSANLDDNFFHKNQFRLNGEDFTPLELWRASQAPQASPQDRLRARSLFHWRLGQVLMPLSFALLGVPLALVRPAGGRGGRGRGALLAVLGYAGFYLVARAALQLAERGQLSAALAGQAANLLFAVVGAALLWRAALRGVA